MAMDPSCDMTIVEIARHFGVSQTVARDAIRSYRAERQREQTSELRTEKVRGAS